MRNHFAADGCEQGFVDFCKNVLSIAQSAFLMAVVWAQIGNVIVRKTQVATSLSKSRLFVPMLWSVFGEIVLIVILIYVPGLNDVFMLSHLSEEFFF
jgi:hypothetical protein